MSERPVDSTARRTADLPPTRARDRTIPASAWNDAPDDLLALGDDLPGAPEAEYLRRIKGWLLWRAGPPNKGEARYWAGAAVDPRRSLSFRLHADGSGEGSGPGGRRHDRFRTWKEDLRDHPTGDDA